MSLKLTEKDKKLLLFLVIVLLVFGVGYCIIVPLYKTNQELTEQISEVRLQQIESETKLNNLAVIESACNSKKEEVAVLEEEFLAPMTATGVDNLLTTMAFEHGTIVQNLTISMPSSNVAELKNYATTIYGGDLEGTEEEKTQFDGVGVVGISMVLSGSKDKLQDIVDTYLAMEPKLRATGINWSLGESDEGTVSINMELYMIMREEM